MQFCSRPGWHRCSRIWERREERNCRGGRGARQKEEIAKERSQSCPVRRGEVVGFKLADHAVEFADRASESAGSNAHLAKVSCTFVPGSTAGIERLPANI